MGLRRFLQIICLVIFVNSRKQKIKPVRGVLVEEVLQALSQSYEAISRFTGRNIVKRESKKNPSFLDLPAKFKHEQKLENYIPSSPTSMPSSTFPSSTFPSSTFPTSNNPVTTNPTTNMPR